eukprot:9758_1
MSKERDHVFDARTCNKLTSHQMEQYQQVIIIIVSALTLAIVLCITVYCCASVQSNGTRKTKVSLNELRAMSIRNDRKTERIETDNDNDTANAMQSFDESECKATQQYSPDSESSCVSMGDVFDRYNRHQQYHEQLRKEGNVLNIVEMLRANKIWKESEIKIKVYLLLNHYPYAKVFEALRMKQIIHSLPSHCHGMDG